MRSTWSSLQSKAIPLLVLVLQQISPSSVYGVQDLGTEHPELVGGFICIEMGRQGLTSTSKSISKHTQDGKFLPSSFRVPSRESLPDKRSLSQHLLPPGSPVKQTWSLCPRARYCFHNYFPRHAPDDQSEEKTFYLQR